MPSTYSTNLAIELIGTGEQAGTWGVTTNTNLGTLIEQAISGYVTQAVSTGATTTLTIPNGATGVARNMYIELTGTGGASTFLEVPSNRKLYFIFNNSTGAVTVRVTGQTGVSVPAAAKVILVSNGTDIVNATDYIRGDSANITVLTSSSATITNLLATTAQFGSASISNADILSAVITGATITSSNITTLTGTTLTYGSASIATLTGSSMNVTTATHASANITTLTGTTLTYGSASITTLTGSSMNVTTATHASANITTLAGTTASYGSASLTGLNAASANITTLTGTTVGYASASITTITGTTIGTTASATIRGISGSITTLTGTSADITTITGTTIGTTASATIRGASGAITNLSVTSLTVSSLTLTTATFTSATITNLNSTSANITTLTGTTASYGSASLTGLNAASANITTLSGTTLSYGSASLTNFKAVSAVITSATVTGLGVTSAAITTLTGTTLGYASASVTNINIATSATIGRFNAGSSAVSNLFASGTIVTSGNIGVAVSPTNNTLGKTIQNGQAAAWVSETSTNRFWLGSNWYYDVSDKYINNGFATLYTQQNGKHIWLNSASGTANAAISFTEAMTLDASGNLGVGTTSPSGKLSVVEGSAPAIRIQGDATTSVGRLSFTDNGVTRTNALLTADNSGNLAFATNGTTERVRITSGGDVGIGTSSPAARLHVDGQEVRLNNSSGPFYSLYVAGTREWYLEASAGALNYIVTANKPAVFGTNNTERARITSDGNILVGKTNDTDTNPGVRIVATGLVQATRDQADPLSVNRTTNDGTLVSLRQDGTEEGTISVSGNTVSYNAFAGSHWSQLQDGSKPDILRGTVMESINELCVWPGEQNERLPKSKVSDTAGSKKVYGVFMTWDDDWTVTNDMYVTAVGAFICRVNGSVTVQEGDLLESNGDGTARVQADDIIRSSTIGKVTSTVKTHQYADGSYCVPTVLYCG